MLKFKRKGDEPIYISTHMVIEITLSRHEKILKSEKNSSELIGRLVLQDLRKIRTV